MLVLALAQPASAHVSIEPPTAVAGSVATIAFRVPNEKPDAATVRLQVQLPPEHPFASVTIRPVPGWTAKTEKRPGAAPAEGNQRPDAVSVITWEGGRIDPGQYQDFEVAVGPLPGTTQQLLFPAIQTYDDGDEVAWISKPVTTGSPPEHPAPELDVVAAEPGAAVRDAHGAVVPSGAASPTPTTAPPVAPLASAPTAAASSDAATTVAGLGLGVAVVALVLGLVALALSLRGRRSTPAP